MAAKVKYSIARRATIILVAVVVAVVVRAVVMAIWIVHRVHLRIAVAQ